MSVASKTYVRNLRQKLNGFHRLEATTNRLNCSNWLCFPLFLSHAAIYLYKKSILHLNTLARELWRWCETETHVRTYSTRSTLNRCSNWCICPMRNYISSIWPTFFCGPSSSNENKFSFKIIFPKIIPWLDYSMAYKESLTFYSFHFWTVIAAVIVVNMSTKTDYGIIVTAIHLWSLGMHKGIRYVSNAVHITLQNMHIIIYLGKNEAHWFR